MKIFALTFLMMGVMACSGIIISPFGDVDSFVKHGKYIVIAECISVTTNMTTMVDGHEVAVGFKDGLHPVEVKIIRSLKGDKPLGKQTIATIYTMTPGKRYLLYSLPDCLGYDTDFFAVPELSVVEVSDKFDLGRLDGKPVTEQVSMLFADRLARLKIALRELEAEKSLLEKATKK
jgi:hypothetical protein